jgi:hypothetical protein
VDGEPSPTPSSAGFCVEVAGAWPCDLVYVEIEDRSMITVPNSVLSMEDS